MKKRRVPYGVEMQIVRRRMETDVKTVCAEFDVSPQLLNEIMKRNEDLVEEARRLIRQEVLEGIVSDARNPREDVCIGR